MIKYALNPKASKSARVYGRALRVSRKSSVLVCKKLSKMKLERGKSFLRNLIDEKENISGKHYTNTAKELSNLLASAEANAEAKGLDLNKIYISASANKGFTFWRPRNWKQRRTKRKMSNIQIVLEEK
ncbi:MAG: uL22 family ribosomal protein [Nanoarchaeota archaeon]